MARKIEIVLATRNKKKKKEIAAILKNLPIKLIGLSDFPSFPEVREDAPTFRGNALKKARLAARFTGRLALADDSGLEVKALKGRPGVLSARYAGRQGNYRANNRKLLRDLRGVPFSKRRASFRCLAVLADPKKVIKVVEGKCSGYILGQFRGKRGFGYDPLFYYPPYKKTFAELLPGKKNKVSHRFRAFKKMAGVIEKLIA